MTFNFNNYAQSENNYVPTIDSLIKKNDYKSAYHVLLKVFKTDIELSGDLCYYYGKTLFHLSRFNESETVLEKFLNSSNLSNNFVMDAKLMLEGIKKNSITKTVNKNFCEEIENCTNCNGEGIKKKYCKTCAGNQKVLCKDCMGSKVVVQKNAFQQIYKPCTYCLQKGFIVCNQCNNNNNLGITCKLCSGFGYKLIKKVCPN